MEARKRINAQLLPENVETGHVPGKQTGIDSIHHQDLDYRVRPVGFRVIEQNWLETKQSPGEMFRVLWKPCAPPPKEERHCSGDEEI